MRFVAGGRVDSTTWRLPGGALSARGLCVVIRPAGSEIGRTTIRPELTDVVLCPARFGLREMESGNLWGSAAGAASPGTTAGRARGLLVLGSASGGPATPAQIPS